MPTTSGLIAALCAAVVLAVPVPVAARDAHDLEFHALFPGDQSGEELACASGDAAYDPLRAGQTLQLESDTGDAVGLGILEAVVPSSRDGMCETSVVFTDVPDASAYSVLAGDRAIASRDWAELEASGWVTKAQYGTHEDPLTPQAADGSDIDDVALSYLLVMNDWTARLYELDSGWEAAGDDPEKLAQMWLKSADFEQGRLDDVMAIGYPPELEGQVERLKTTTEEFIAAQRMMAERSNTDAAIERYLEVEAANAEAYAEMRRVLDLPALVADAQPTAEPAPETVERYGVKQWVPVYDNGDPELRVKVLDVRQDRFFQSSGLRTKPSKGNVYLSVLLRYEALANGAGYDPDDWQVFVDDEAYGGRAPAIGGRQPALGSGDLAKGRKVKGWVTFEVPKIGQALLTHKSGTSSDNSTPPFEVVVRQQ